MQGGLAPAGLLIAGKETSSCTHKHLCIQCDIRRTSAGLKRLLASVRPYIKLYYHAWKRTHPTAFRGYNVSYVKQVLFL